MRSMLENQFRMYFPFHSKRGDGPLYSKYPIGVAKALLGARSLFLLAPAY